MLPEDETASLEESRHGQRLFALVADGHLKEDAFGDVEGVFRLVESGDIEIDSSSGKSRATRLLAHWSVGVDWPLEPLGLCPWTQWPAVLHRPADGQRRYLTDGR
jgi:hypothetical protein